MSCRASIAVVVSVAVVMRLFAVSAAEDPGLRLPPLPLGPVVVLADGGVVAGRLESITPETLVIESPVLGRLELPRASVAGYRASMALGPVPPRRPDPATGEAAAVRLVNGDAVLATGLTLAAGDVTIGVAAPLRQDVVVPLELVRAIDFSVLPREMTLPRKFIALSDGSRFVEASLPGTRDPAEVATTLVDGGPRRLLQSMEPVAWEQPAAGLPARGITRGSTLSGDWPSARGATAFTGLGLRAPACVRYRFDTPARRFESLVAIDDAAGQGGSVIVRVRAIDAVGECRDVHASPILRGGDEPHAIDVDLGGAVGLELIVEPATAGSDLDRTVWLDPRVVLGRGEP